MDKLPTYWGFWKSVVGNNENLFFLTILEHERVFDVGGTIVDKLGVSNFKGIFSPEHVSFTKTYIPESSRSIASLDPVHYQGSWKQGNRVIEGTYTIEQTPLGTFTMEPFPSESTIALTLRNQVIDASYFGRRLSDELRQLSSSSAVS